MSNPRGKLYFRNPKIKECVGQAEAGTCLQCIKRDQAKAMSCKRLGDFLNKNDWNKIIRNGALQVKDFKARESTVSPDALGNQREIDRFGKFTPRKVA